MTNTTPTPLDNPDGIAAAKERIYGVLTKTSIDLPNNQRRIAGGGGLYSTAEDLADFLLAHMNKGRHGNFQLLQPETISLMHSPIRTQGGDFMQVGYGYGWGIYQDEPRQMWDITFQPRGYQGHGGSYLGYLGAMYMVEEQQGAYGYVLLTNTSHVVKTDYPWHFATNLNIGNLILQEAHRIFQASVNQ